MSPMCTHGFVYLNQCFVLFAIFTKISMTGTSVRTPTTVANTAGDVGPNNAIATATASSKKLDAPIMPAGAATSCVKSHFFAPKYEIKKMKNV